MPSRFFSRLFGPPVIPPVVAPAPMANAPAVSAAPSAARAALIADALRIRAEMRERIGVEKLRVLHRMLTGKDPE